MAYPKTLKFCTYPKGHFQVLAAPNIHSFVIGSNLIKVVFVNRKEATSHCWSMQRLRSVATSSVHFSLRYTIPRIKHKYIS